MKLSSRQLISLALLARGYSRVGKIKLTLMNLHEPWQFRISETHKNKFAGADRIWITDRGAIRTGATFSASRPIPRAQSAILRAAGAAIHAAAPPATTLEELGL